MPLYLAKSTLATQKSNATGVFFLIFIPLVVGVFLVLVVLFECWVRRRRRARDNDILLGWPRRSYDGSPPPHPRLFHELNESDIGARVVELDQLSPLLPDQLPDDINELDQNELGERALLL